MPELRRGSAAITAENKGGGDFKPFAPSLRWTENGEEKYVLVLTPISETPRVQIHEFVKIGQKDNGKPKFGFWISRKDPGVGESHDPLIDDFDIKPSDRCIGVGVELEPEFESGGRARPRIKGFTVKVDTYDKKNEDGSTEEVVFPLLGIITQSPSNFYNHLTNFDESEGPLEELPLKIRRIGKSKDTQYSFTPYLDQEVDLSNLTDHIDGISYLREEKLDTPSGDPIDAAKFYADALLEKRLNELLDKEDYEQAVAPLDQIAGFKEVHYRANGNGDSHNEVDPTESDETTEPEEDSVEDKDSAFARIREKAATKAKSKA